MTSTLATYLQIATNTARYQKITEAEPMVKSQTEYYQANIGNVKTPSDLVNNYRLFSYVMTAYGLGDMVSYGKGEIQKVLEQGTNSSSDLAYTLTNSKILALAKDFNFVNNGASTTSSEAVKTGVVNNYVEQQLESDQGQSNAGVELALHFKANASNITSAYNILADKSLLTVVETALGISQYIAYEDIDTQAKLITTDLKAAGMNISDFQDSTKVDKFIQKFTAMYDATNGSPSSDLTVPSALLDTSSSTTSFSSSLLTSMQGLKLGGF